MASFQKTTRAMGSPSLPTAHLLFIDKDPQWAGPVKPATTRTGILTRPS